MAEFEQSAAAEQTLSTRRHDLARADGVERLTTIALIASLHFVVSFTSILPHSVLATVLGPYAIFITGVLDQGFQGLLLTTVLVLYPQVGTAALQMLTVFLLNAILGGSLNISSLLLIAASMLVHEAILWTGGVTRNGELRATGRTPTWTVVLRVALAVGVCKGAAAAIQYGLAIWLYQLFFSAWFVASAVLIASFGYASVGAALGVSLGYYLRRTSP